MSILKACSLVPEILLDAPEEIENQSIKKRFAEAIAVVFLRTLRVGCIVTVRGGKGVLLKKKEDGSWSAPLALMFGGPALGASIGLEVADLIMFINSKEVLDGFLKKNPGLGLSGGLALGPIGRTGEAMVSVAAKKGMVAYYSTKGFYGGVNMEISGIMVDKTANKVQYGVDKSTPSEILDNTLPPEGEIFSKMYESLNAVLAEKKKEENTPNSN